jgi:hypothetical protein
VGQTVLRETGVELSSILPLYTWSSTDETERQAAVRYWRRMIEVAVELDVHTMNSEFNGRPEHAAQSEAAFWRSLDELLPIFERKGIALNLEAHPDDFCELNNPAVDLVRAINKPWVNYLYCAPHTFHLFDGIATICVFAWEERATESSKHMLERVTKELAGQRRCRRPSRRCRCSCRAGDRVRCARSRPPPR